MRLPKQQRCNINGDCMICEVNALLFAIRYTFTLGKGIAVKGKSVVWLFVIFKLSFYKQQDNGPIWIYNIFLLVLLLDYTEYRKYSDGNKNNYAKLVLNIVVYAASQGQIIFKLHMEQQMQQTRRDWSINYSVNRELVILGHFCDFNTKIGLTVFAK